MKVNTQSKRGLLVADFLHHSCHFKVNNSFIIVKVNVEMDWGGDGVGWRDHLTVWMKFSLRLEGMAVYPKETSQIESFCRNWKKVRCVIRTARGTGKKITHRFRMCNFLHSRSHSVYKGYKVGMWKTRGRPNSDIPFNLVWLNDK